MKLNNDANWAEHQYETITPEDSVAFDLSADGERYMRITGGCMTVNLGRWSEISQAERDALDAAYLKGR